MLARRTAVRRSTPASRSSVIPLLLWLVALALVVRMSIGIRKRPGSQFQVVDVYALAQMALVGLSLLLVLAAPNVKRTARVVARTSAGMLVLYYALCAVSALWSPIPAFSMYRAVEVLSQLFVVFVALSACDDFLEAERTLLFVSLVVLVLGMAARVRLYGASLTFHRLHGVRYGASAAMLCCYCSAELFASNNSKRKRMLARYGIVSLAFLILAHSAGSMLATLSGAAAASFLLRRRKCVPAILLSLLAVLAFWKPEVARTALFPYKSEGEIETLTSRTSLWEGYLDSLTQRPVLGDGFAVSARLSETYAISTHSAVFSVLLGTGALGMVIVLSWLLLLAKEMMRHVSLRRIGAVGCAAALTAGLVNSMSMPVIGEQWHPPTLIFACLLALHILYVAPRPPIVTILRPGAQAHDRGLHVPPAFMKAPAPHGHRAQ